MPNAFIARQPIYDRALDVIGYELLFRSGETSHANFADADQATSQVMLNAFMEIGLENIVGEHLAFFNLTRAFIVGHYRLPFPPGRGCLEILESVAMDDAVVAAVRHLSSQGYTIVLDDFVYHEKLRPLVEIADIIKIDVLAQGHVEVQRDVSLLRKYGAKLLAEKVETQEMLDFCRELGFDYYQGYFFCKPKVISGSRMPTNRIAALQLLAALQNPDISVTELETLVERDVAMSYKLMRCINSAFYSLPRKVESIRQAIIILGSQWLRTWVSLMVLTNIDDKPRELLVTAMVRAKMCELLATAAGQKGSERFFVAGLFSVLDALMDRPLEDLLKMLPLADEVSNALLHYQGPIGKTLKCVLAYDRGQWDDVHCPVMDTAGVAQAYLDSVAWAEQVGQALLLENDAPPAARR
ncbi:MAG: HDOD domain-containing protein [Gammaproteobacteria bacterium]|nr:HDOD domain-containing protein [Gammaproteobacteria bacterium]